MFKNMKLTTKIMGGMSTIIIGMLIITITSYNGIHKIADEIKEIANYEAPLLASIVEIQKDVLTQEVLTLNLIISAKDVHSAKFKSIEKEIHSLEKTTEKNILKCEHLAQKAADLSHADIIKNQYLNVLKTCKLVEKEQHHFEETLTKLAHNLKTENTQNINKEKKVIEKDLHAMTQQITELTAEMEKLSHTLLIQAEEDENSILLTVELTALFFLILAIIITVALNKNIKNNIRNFQGGLLSFFKYLNRESSLLLHHLTTVVKMK